MRVKKKMNRQSDRLAQLVERFIHIEEVGGPNPPAVTICGGSSQTWRACPKGRRIEFSSKI